MNGRHVEVEHRDAVAVLTLVDTERRNAMTLPMVEEIVAAVDALETDGTTGALVVTGAPPAFCSGADLASLGRYSETADAGERRGVVAVYEGFLRILRSTLPTVAAVNGPAVGAGMNLALACDVRIAATSARFDTRFLRLGLHPGGGHLWMLERALGPQGAAALALFGEVLDGPAAAGCGLAWRCVDDETLVDAAADFATRAAGVPRDLMVRAKQTLRAAPWQPGFDAALAAEIEHQQWSLAQGWFRRP